MELLLTSVLFIVCCFIGKGKGVAAYLIGTVAIIVMSNHQADMLQLYNNHQLPLLIGASIIPIISIMISRWWGLFFYLFASIAVTALVIATVVV